MVFIDTNIFMYAAGREHHNKIPSLNFLHKIAAGKIDACINVEVLQEILHRYRHINRWENGREVYSLTRKIVSAIFPVDTEIMKKCFDLMNQYPGIMARDALHIGFCQIHSITSFYSYDRDFDIIEGINRIEP